MRQSNTCPKCSQNEILFLPRLTDFQHSTLAAHVDDQWAESGKLKVVGAIQAYVCRNCGFTELYMTDPLKVDPKKVQGAKIMRPHGGGPYR
jgi:hypothetical protein